jgi:hypothetical protein
MDCLMKYRLGKQSETKKPLFRPQLKIHKLFGEKKLLSLSVVSV